MSAINKLILLGVFFGVIALAMSCNGNKWEAKCINGVIHQRRRIGGTHLAKMWSPSKGKCNGNVIINKNSASYVEGHY